jgi:hypothetical protein
MELPPILVDKYRRYKKETEVFVSWLASAARSTGADKGLFVKTEAAENGGRLKGKARKDAAKAKAQVYQVPVNAFTKLAAAVAGSAKVEVPKHMLSILRDVIRARKDCAAFYSRKPTNLAEGPDQIDEQHTHFIDILEAVLTTLCAKRGKEHRQWEDIEDDTEEQLKNIFEHLTLEETAESDSPIEPPSKPKVKLPTPTIKYKLEAADDDAKFAIFCFLNDCTDIRLFVRRTWRYFQQGRVTLETAALTMNSAIGLIERLDVKFAKDYPQFCDHAEMFTFLTYAHFQVVDHKIYVGDWSTDFPYENGEQKLSYFTVICYDTWQLLRHFVHEDVDLNEQTLEKLPLTADETTLVKCLHEMKHKEAPFAHDIIFGAVKKVSQEKLITSWAVFAVQIFWDTQRELGNDMEKAFLAARSTAIWLLTTLRHYLSLEVTNDLPAGDRHQMQLLHDEINKVFVVNYGLSAKDTTKYEENGGNFSWSLYQLSSHHPMLCGLYSQYYLSRFHEFATSMDGERGIITAAAHLHNAVSQAGLLASDITWKDMDWMI